jgi:hypothetical protein
MAKVNVADGEGTPATAKHPVLFSNDHLS